MHALNRDYVRRLLLARPEGSPEAVERAINTAVDVLSNLIHYSSGRSHYDQDVVTVAQALLARRQS